MKFKFLIFLIFLIKTISPQILHQSHIDSILSEENEALIYKENRIILVLTNFSLEIKNCQEKLKNLNIKNNLTTAVGNYLSLIQQLMTLKSYENYVNISTCGDINRKITFLDFDDRKTRLIMSKVAANLTAINKANAEVLTAYNLNLGSLGYQSDNAKSVFAITSRTSSIVAEYLDYNRILVLHIGKLAQFNAFLTIFKKKYCQCLTTVAWTGSNSTLESNVEVVENQLLAEQTKITKLTSVALAKVKMASLQPLQKIFTNIQNISDYKKVNWHNIKNCNDFWLRIKFLQFKQLQYLSIYQSASLNYSRIVAQRSLVNATNSNSGNSALKDAMNATMTVEDRFAKYVSLLIYSVVKMSRMIGDFNAFGDTYCSCEIEGSTTTTNTDSTTTTVKDLTTSTTIPMAVTTTLAAKSSTIISSTTTATVATTSTSSVLTTTVIPTTTTTAPPCGTFVAYDTVNAIQSPEIFGFEGGVNQDGKTKQYVGYGNGEKLGCGIQSECPGYINTISSGPGCYMPCGNLLYDRNFSFYLLNHSDLVWIPSDTVAMRTLPGTIKAGTKTVQPFLFGRIKSNGHWTLGKIHNGGTGGYTFYIQEASKSVPYYNGFEVLSCVAPITTTTLSTTTTTTETPCGTFALYDPINAPDLTNLGFLSGTYYDGSKIFPGTLGRTDVCGGQVPGPAQIMATNNFFGSGGYHSCSGSFHFDNITSKYLVYHPKLKWVPTTGVNASKISGAIKMQSRLLMYFGRMNFTWTNGTFSLISKIYGTNLWYKNPFSAAETTTKGALDVLVCEP